MLAPKREIINCQLCISALLCIFSCVGTPLVFLLWIPSKIYKTFVNLLAKVFRSDLRPITNPKCVILTDDNLYQNPSNCSIVALVAIKGLHLSLPQVTSLFEEKVIHACMQNESKTLRYPELQEYPVNFMGYPFFQKEAEFDPRDHISEYQEGTNLSESEIHQIMLNRSFSKCKSPWELKLFRNNKPTESLLLALRIHHSLCDGRSVVKLLVECLGNQKLSVTDAKFPKRDWKEQAKYFILLPFQLVQVGAYLMGLQIKFFGHPWQHKTFPQNKSPLFASISPKIDMNMVKNVAKVAGVQTTSVIICGIMGAIGQYFERKKNVYKYLPKYVPIYLALPKDSHPSTFSNHLTIVIPEVAVAFKEGEAKRLEMCDKMYKKMRQGDHTHHLEFLTGILTEYPKPLRTHLTTMHGVPTGISNIAGEQNGFSVGGYPCLDFNLSAGMPQGSIGISFTLLSYKSHFQLSIIANGSILSEEDTLFMGKLVESQFTNLSKAILDEKNLPS